MPRRPEINREIKENRRKQIKLIALEMFAERGYSHTSIQSISQKANISKGLIYSYFPSKEALLRSVMNEGLEEMFKLFDLNNDGAITRDELINFIQEIFELMKKDIAVWRLYFSLMMQPSVWKIIEVKVQEMITPYMTLMTKYFTEKEVSDPETEALLLGALLDGISFNYVFNPEVFPLDRVVDILIERFI